MTVTLQSLWHFFYGFQGRIDRLQYWLGLLTIVATALVPLLLLPEIARAAGAPQRTVMAIIAIVVVVFCVVPALAIMIKRLHDRDKSGSWVVLLYFAPYWLGKLSDKAPEGSPLWWCLATVAVVLSAWGLIEFGCLPGTKGPNRYGEGTINVFSQGGPQQSLPKPSPANPSN